MNWRHTSRWARISATTGLAVLASLFATMSPAQAWSPNPTTYWITQDAGDCAKDGGHDPDAHFAAYRHSSTACVITGRLAAYYFDIDGGSAQNAMWEIGPHGYVAFEGYGEHLVVADVANDGDSFYVWVNGDGPYGAGGTSEEFDSTSHDLDLLDDQTFTIKITDDQAGTDPIFNGSARA